MVASINVMLPVCRHSIDACRMGLGAFCREPVDAFDLNCAFMEEDKWGSGDLQIFFERSSCTDVGDCGRLLLDDNFFDESRVVGDLGAKSDFPFKLLLNDL